MDTNMQFGRVGHVPVYSDIGEDSFASVIYQKRQPAIIKSWDIGPCVHRWSWDYLSKLCGDRNVKIHVSPSAQMDFINKNFIYRSIPFNQFIERIQQEEQTSYFLCEKEKYYLRSLGDDPRADVADITKDFPELSGDVKIPKVFEPDHFFSSVFRISSKNLQLWTHYDVMDNILVMVSGKKRVVLFEPKDALFLYLQDDKSKVLDIDNPDVDMFPEFHKATRYECILSPGDILFIPALWFHNVINVECGVAVNVFWRHLREDQYDKSDIYGNKDPVVVTRAMQMVERSLKLIETLPVEYSDFYCRKVIAKMHSRLKYS